MKKKGIFFSIYIFFFAYWKNTKIPSNNCGKYRNKKGMKIAEPTWKNQY